jgi:hypothetical protein
VRTNKKVKREPVHTHGGAPADHINAEQRLRRSVLATMLFEGQFYEEGKPIADRIIEVIPNVRPEIAAKVAIEARKNMRLRHVPLLVARTMAGTADGHRKHVEKVLTEIIQRPDEIAEFLSIYWKSGKQPLAASVKRGLAKAFQKFDEYQIAKYNRDSEIKLRDVMFLVHAKPKGGVKGFTKEARRNLKRFEKIHAEYKAGETLADLGRKYEMAVVDVRKAIRAVESIPKDKGSLLYSKLVQGTLATPDTWESHAAAGKEKKENFTDLMQKEKLGGMAFLRNLRGMSEAGVSKARIDDYFDIAKFGKVLPFRFISAAMHAPRFEHKIQDAMLDVLSQRKKLPGKTILIVDVSGSMYGGTISKYSEMDRAKVACSLAILVRELCEEPVIYATAGSDAIRKHQTALVPSRRGFALSDAIFKMCQPLGGGGIFLKQVTDFVKAQEKSCERIIVITDEQDTSGGGANAPSKAQPFGTKGNYIINVASAENGIGYAKWLKINGFSEAVLDYILEYEKEFSIDQVPAQEIIL